METAKDTTGVYFGAGISVGILSVPFTIALEVALLRQLSVFNTPVGFWLLLYELLAGGALLLVMVVAGSLICQRLQKRTGRRRQWLFYYVLLGIGSGAAFAVSIGDGLSYDVSYSTVSTKAGLDFLALRYLNGATIWVILILTLVFMLSDPRVSYVSGDDGVRHLYMHSKFLGLVRLIRGRFSRGLRGHWAKSAPGSTQKEVEWDIGQTPDHAVVSRDGRLRWNDRFRISSPWFIGWTGVKVFLAVAVASRVAGDIALRFLAIQNYLNQTNSSWQGQLASYLAILNMRISGVFPVSASFAIDNSFTFEVFRLTQSLVGLALVVIGIRLGLSAVANLVVGASKTAFGMYRRAVGNILGVLLLPMAYSLIGAGTWVYDVGTVFTLWVLIIVLAGTALLTALSTTHRIFTPSNISRTAAIIMLGLVIFGTAVLPTYGFYLRSQSGKYIDYQWTPAFLPTIEYTRWAYSLDGVSSANLSLISSVNSNETLHHVRVFTDEAAKLNMKPLVGVNWMSINNSDVDIVFYNGTEYWVSVLQPVRPPYFNDPDVWRSEHLLLTHSEKILAVNAATTQTVDIGSVWNLTQTPQLYYGEGGLWRSVDQVYLDIPSFNETHLSGYKGPSAYDGNPDYTYTGFWRYWKFFWQGRYDFANGDYGDVKALVDRDVNLRVSKLLLPGMKMDPDPYPVVDDNGNLYLLHWLWVDWKSPHEFADYPEHSLTSIVRLFAAVVTNLKTGEMQGYLYKLRPVDYVLSFYQSMYPQWNNPVPSWLVPLLRYPETFFEAQQEVYNFYFQTDPLEWQRNVFLQSAEDTRFVITPINGAPAWAAMRLEEVFQSPSMNLAGLYIAPAGSETGKIYLIRFPDNMTIIGPDAAMSAIITDPGVKAELTLHPDWISGNILIYYVNGRLTYIVPYYGTRVDLNVPVMVAAVDGETKQVGAAFIEDPTNFAEVNGAATIAVDNIGLGTLITITGNVTYTVKYDVSGNTRWNIGITTATGAVEVYAHAETLVPADITAIDQLVAGDAISVVVDSVSHVIEEVLVP